jgi:hypothetical protein
VATLLLLGVGWWWLSGLRRFVEVVDGAFVEVVDEVFVEVVAGC